MNGIEGAGWKIVSDDFGTSGVEYSHSVSEEIL
jgi:hypothetical protein